ncbi:MULTISPECIES: DUF6676 family protein [Corynebacterium]|uniref:Uncharacterized protein n=1 Tax=Corynebacterium freneyi TaxID=134034 RepID=A0ABS4U781_9CORY|nr:MULTISPECIES: DUF6676 family protein [Corynebacterium]MBP2332509.1 hypothetical protein [Corynebacterium freneyi]QXA53318.1 hypothetical protein I6L56_02665 [Corynebacterium freneyi]UBI01298.1 hypothetical protein LA334_06990 [Corynebacterium freneyi]WJZ05385.1 hypothetical protein CFREN_07080 [Corynebacterium freneyi]
MSEGTSMYLENLDAKTVSEALQHDPIVTANEDLEAALRPIVDSAPARGIEDLKVVIVDKDPMGTTDLRNFANEVVAEDGGTVIVRAPFSVSAASDEIPQAALEQAGFAMMEDYPERYPQGFDAFIDIAGDWTVPWVNYSLAVGGGIVVVFAALIAFWWIRSHRGNRG